MNNKTFSTHEAAQICKTSDTTVISWIEKGKLKACTGPGGHRSINEEDLVSFLNKHEMPVPPELKKLTKSILVVDDDLEALDEYRCAMQDGGFSLYFASSGFEAGVMVYKHRPDIILLDFKMAGMNGFDVCDILRKDKETAKIPVFAVTALNSQDDIRRIKECGVKQYIPKPVNMDELMRLIRQTIGTGE